MKILLLSLALISASMFCNAEGNEETKMVMQTLTFKVVDSNNESIAGAEVKIEGLGIVSYTDMEGNYKIEIPKNINEDLTISFISFEDKVLNINNIKENTITLIEE